MANTLIFFAEKINFILMGSGAECHWQATLNFIHLSNHS